MNEDSSIGPFTFSSGGSSGCWYYTYYSPECEIESSADVIELERMLNLDDPRHP